MITRIHVNQHNIKHNSKHKNKKPVLTAKTYKENQLGNTVVIRRQGVEVARVMYSPDKPLGCGARVWIETKCEVEVR